jgi:hypothetical protein
LGLYKKNFENLGIVPYSIEMFSKKLFFGKWRKQGGGFIKWHCV